MTDESAHHICAAGLAALDRPAAPDGPGNLDLSDTPAFNLVEQLDD